MIGALLAKLYGVGLLLEPDALTAPRTAPRHDSKPVQRLQKLKSAWKRLSFTIPNADQVCSNIYRRGGFLLFHPIAFCLAVAIAVGAAGAALSLGTQANRFTHTLATVPWLSAGAILAAVVVVSAIHVLIHALACKAFHRRVREMGFFLLQGLIPTFYADVTDIFMSTRRARLIVDMAGPMVEVVLGSAAFLGASAATGVGQALLFSIGVLLWEGAFINLYPFNFLEMDGYNILADVMAIPTLRQQSLALLAKLPSRLRRLRTIERAEWIQITYLLLSFASVAVYVAVHLGPAVALLAR
jgi:putative peptide zinc metalloprotease protein